MAALKVNVESIISTAEALSEINKQIDEEYEALDKKMKELGEFWKGPAAEAAIAKYWEIKSKYFSPRHDVVENYITFLRQQVGEGYAATEKTNTSLADAFK